MKRVHRHYVDVSQGLGDRGTDVVERHLALYGVSRASELPEEGRVLLYRELRRFFDHELPAGLPNDERWSRGWLGALHRRWRQLCGWSR